MAVSLDTIFPPGNNDLECNEPVEWWFEEVLP
jgi:hypothetical protein